MLGVYGRSLTWFLRHRYLSALTWVVCLVGHGLPFTILPKTFLPVGDSGFIWGLMIGPDKASYQQMRQYQDMGDELMQADPGVAATFTMTGNGQFLTYNQGLLLAFLEPREKRAADRRRSPAELVRPGAGRDDASSARSRCCRSAPARRPTARPT